MAGNTFEDLADKVRRLHALTSDPHPGLATWCSLLVKAEAELRELLAARADEEREAASGGVAPAYKPPNISSKVVLLSLMRGSLEVDTPEDMRRNLDSAAFLVIPNWPAKYTWWLKSPAEWDEWIREMGFL